MQDKVRTYRAVIWPKPDIPVHEYDIALLRMELTFAVGRLAPVTDPTMIVERTLKDLHLQMAMELISIEEVELTDGSVYSNDKPDRDPA